MALVLCGGLRLGLGLDGTVRVRVLQYSSSSHILVLSPKWYNSRTLTYLRCTVHTSSLVTTVLYCCHSTMCVVLLFTVLILFKRIWPIGVSNINTIHRTIRRTSRKLVVALESDASSHHAQFILLNNYKINTIIASLDVYYSIRTTLIFLYCRSSHNFNFYNDMARCMQGFGKARRWRLRSSFPSPKGSLLSNLFKGIISRSMTS